MWLTTSIRSGVLVGASRKMRSRPARVAAWIHGPPALPAPRSPQTCRRSASCYHPIRSLPGIALALQHGCREAAAQVDLIHLRAAPHSQDVDRRFRQLSTFDDSRHYVASDLAPARL